MMGNTLQAGYPQNVSYESCQIDSGLVCGGSQDVRWTANDTKYQIAYNTPLTMSFFLKTKSSPDGVYNELLGLYKDASNCFGFDPIYQAAIGKWVFDIYLNLSGNVVLRRYFGLNGGIYYLDMNGTTKHICVTKAADTTAAGLKLYINGVQYTQYIQEVTSGGTTAAGSGWYPKIGSLNYAATNDHTVDHFKFYKGYEATLVDVQRLSRGRPILGR